MNTTFRIIVKTLAVVVILSVPLQNLIHGASAEEFNPLGQRRPHLQPVHAATLNTTPRGFIPNVGQMPNEAVKFVIRDSGVSAYFTDQGFVLWNGQTTTVSRDGVETKVPVAPRWELVGARPVKPVGGETFAHTVSFFRGNDAAKWRANLPAYREISYPEILAGVEMRVESREQGFEYSFYVRPGAKADLRIRYEGITVLTKSLLGDLTIYTEKGHFTEGRPVSYQVIEGTKRLVESSFEVIAPNEFRIVVGAYDERHELVIDPVLDWSTFLGGSYLERFKDVDIHEDGSIYVFGDTVSSNLPETAGGFGTGPGAPYTPTASVFYEDSFLAKFNSSGTQLIWSGYLSGNGITSDVAGLNGLVVDSLGNAYVAGLTTSTDFPRTTGAVHAGGYDAYITKISSTGSAILWSSLVGGTSEDLGWDSGAGWTKPGLPCRPHLIR